ncbi:hypothetical protein [Fonticella tunisiensis]|uniref:Uncharacterized protein n=1 Tax=Fonticella tunisiensis TaxID=1096341 RepID=A0A4R7KV54_9CLOT|nr:hypothetical protein [Fonticella tunisiensis]TDT63371.1 hypothetical protein EDD71_102131 [Fonticella tunisiensis]
MLNTKEIMDIALSLAGLEEVPADSGIIVEGQNIKAEQMEEKTYLKHIFRQVLEQ